MTKKDLPYVSVLYYFPRKVDLGLFGRAVHYDFGDGNRSYRHPRLKTQARPQAFY